MPDGGKTKALGTASRTRRRLPGDTLIEFELGLRLRKSDKAPVKHGSSASSRAGGPWAGMVAHRCG